MKKLSLVLLITMLVNIMLPFQVKAAAKLHVFELSNEEQNYLDSIKDKPISLAITSEMSSFVSVDGKKSGLLMPLIRLLEDEWGLSVNTVDLGWEESFDQLDSGGVDLAGLALLSENRRGLYKSTDALYYTNMDIFTRTDNPLESMVTLEGKTIGMLSNSTLPEILDIYLTPEGSIIYYKTVDELLHAVEQGEVFCAASSLSIQGELLSHPDVGYEMSLESVVAPQCVYSGSERFAPLIDLINRYTKSPGGISMSEEIELGRRKCTLEKYREFYSGDIAYIKENYDRLRIFDSGMLYPLSYMENGIYQGPQKEINDILHELTGVPVETVNYSGIERIGTALDALKKSEVLAFAGVYRENEIYLDPSLEYSLPLMTDTLSFYVTRADAKKTLSDMRVGSMDFSCAYVDWKAAVGKEPEIYASREVLVGDLRNGRLDAIFVGEMMTDYYYTIMNDYSLKRYGSLAVPVSVHMLYNTKNESFNRIMDAAVKLQTMVDPESRQRWSNNTQNGKFELMRLRNEMDWFRKKTIIAAIILVIFMAVLLVFVLYQNKKFRNYDRQIFRMLSVQGNADMFWGNLKTKKITSKGDYPISKKFGFEKGADYAITDIESIKYDLKKIDDQTLEYYMRNIEIKPRDSGASYFFRRFTHKINENEFMMYVMDFTAEKYRERELDMLANTDALTMLLNRRAMNRILDEKAKELRENSKKIFIFMLDIDDFKKVNDRYGHDIGDKVLGLAARVISGTLSGGAVSRWGGEEFLCAAELENREEAFEMARRILFDFESAEITVGTRESFCSTISCGISELLEGENYSDAITRADKAMYRAKCDGKNCFRFCEKDSTDIPAVLGHKSQTGEAFDITVTYNRIMSRLIHAFFHSGSVDKVIQELLRIASECNGMDRAFVMERTNDGYFKRTYLYDPENYASPDFDGTISDDRISGMGYTGITGPMFISNAREELSEPELAIRSRGLESCVQIPVSYRGGLYAMVVFEKCREHHDWTDEERRIFGDLTIVMRECFVRKKLESELTRSISAMKSVLDSLADIVYVVELETHRFLFANKKTREYINDLNYNGTSPDDIDYRERTCWQILRPDLDGPCDFCAHGCLLDENGDPTGQSVSHEVYNGLVDMWLEVTDTLIDWEGGKKAVLMVCRDITESKRKYSELYEYMQNEKEKQKLLLETLQTQELKTKLALEGANSFSWEYIPEHDKFILSRTAEPALGYPIDHFEQKYSKYLNDMAMGYAADAEERMKSYIEGKSDIYTAEYPMFTADGSVRWYLARGKFDESGQGIIYGVCIDISESKLYEQRLSERAYKDALTGFFSKQYLSDGLIQPSSDLFENLGGILFDIRGLKNINEAFGYNRGDRIIESVAGRLRELLPCKTVVRTSGNRFLAVFENTDAVTLKNHASRILNEFEKPILTDGHMVGVNFKIGITVSFDSDAIKLFKNAEIALYSAKQSITEDCCVLNDSIKSAFTRKVSMEFELRKALERQEFVMYYQPKVSAESYKVVGAESLIRWKHPELGIVSPLDFIPLAEETGLIIPIGEFVMFEVARQLRQWLDQGIDLFLSFNLSAKQFLSPQLISNIRAAIEEYRIPRDRLVIELTESSMIMDFDYVSQFLNELASFGVGVSLDDFGTGYSSMSYLGKIPLDYLKIDKSFIDNVTSASKDRAIVESIVTMSHKLDFKVTAEGVETLEQLNLLKELGCDIIQGYYYSRPLPREEFESYIKSGINGAEI